MIVTCPNCDENTDVIVRTSMGATDLLPDSCSNCDEPWPIDILQTAVE